MRNCHYLKNIDSLFNTLDMI